VTVGYGAVGALLEKRSRLAQPIFDTCRQVHDYHTAMEFLTKPHLSWIEIDVVVALALKRFRKSAEKVREDALDTSRVEPTLAIVRSGLTGKSLQESESLDLAVALTKTIQNAAGMYHQDVLGAVPGWTSTGASGGVIDLKGISPVTGRSIVAESKMRYNTIKASDEAKMWDKLKDAAAVAGGGTLGYLFQIVPKYTGAYDRPWVVSGRNPIETVRCADGVTAYHLVTGHPNALFELMDVMPYVTTQVAESVLGSRENATNTFDHSSMELARIIQQSFPAKSAHA